MTEEITRTFILGPGILVAPNGEEFKCTEFTITQGPYVVMKEGDHIVHIGGPTAPCRIEFRNKSDEE